MTINATELNSTDLQFVEREFIYLKVQRSMNIWNWFRPSYLAFQELKLSPFIIKWVGYVAAG